MLVLGVPLQLRGDTASPGKELVGCAWFVPVAVSSYNRTMTVLLYSIHGDLEPPLLVCLVVQGSWFSRREVDVQVCCTLVAVGVAVVVATRRTMQCQCLIGTQFVVAVHSQRSAMMMMMMDTA